MEIFVGFGASETFMTALRRGFLDTTITVCDGAGTVITGNPRLCQGMGSRISGLTETSPIQGLIKRIEAAGGVVIDPDTAAIDQVSGVRKAIELGFRKIGVSVANLKDLKEITAVPIFAITTRGRELLLERAKEVKDPILVNTMKLPVLPEERQPGPLV